MHLLIEVLFILIAVSIVYGSSSYGWWGRGGPVVPGQPVAPFNVGALIQIAISLVVLYIIYTLVIRVI